MSAGSVTMETDWISIFKRSDLAEIEASVTSLSIPGLLPGKLDKYGNTPVHLAAAYSSLPVLERYLAGGGVGEVNYYGQTVLMSACQDSGIQALDKVRHLVEERGCDVTQTDYCGNSALHVACSVSSLPVIDYLLSLGADLMQENEEGLLLMMRISQRKQWTKFNAYYSKSLTMDDCFLKGETPLTLAASNNSVDVCQHLLSKLSHEEDKKTIVSAMMIRSCVDDSLEKVQYLIEAGGSVDYTEYGINALHVAAEHSSLEVMEFLLNKGSDPHVVTDDGNTILNSAAFSGDKERFGILLKHVSNINVPLENGVQWSPLHAAVITCDLDFVKYLVENGADVNARSASGENMLHLACRDTDLAKVTFLLDKLGVEALMERGENGMTPLHNAAWLSSVDMVKFLLLHGAELHAVDNGGLNTLHWACFGKCTDTVQFLLHEGFSLDCVDFTGETPLSKAVWKSDIQMIDFLISRGANCDSKTENGDTLIHYACCGIQVQNVFYLLSPSFKGRNSNLDRHVNVKNNHGAPAFFRATTPGYKPMLFNLVCWGAELDICDDSGRSALHLACLGTSLPVVKFLCEFGLSPHHLDNRCSTPVQYAAKLGTKEILSFLCGKLDDIGMVDDDNDSLLHWACMGKNAENIDFLIESGIDVNVRNMDGETPMHTATDHGTIETMKSLIDHKALVDEASNNGSAALCVAAVNSSKEKVKLLLDNGANINLQDYDKETVLHKAARYSDSVEMVKYLLKNGADINMKDERGLSTLLMAAHGNSVDVIKELEKQGLSLFDKDRSNNTALHCACAFASIDVIDYLLHQNLDLDKPNNEGLKPLHLLYLNEVSVIEKINALGRVNLSECKNEKGHSPLHIAALNGKLEHVECFIEKAGMDMFSKTDNGDSLLHSACEGNSVDLLEYLIPYFDINIQNIDGGTPIHVAASKGTEDIVSCLIKYSVDINAADNSKFTPLHYAVDHGDLEVVKTLIWNGADIRIRGKNHQSVLHSVAGTRHVQVAEYLLELDIDIDIKDEGGSTPFLFAAGYGSIEMVKCFIDRKAMTDVKSRDNITALHMAARENSADVMEFLLSFEGHDIGLEARDTSDKTPLHYAASEPNERTIPVLIAKGADIKAKDHNGITPLLELCAQQEENSSAVETLLKAGADANEMNNDGDTALTFALLKNFAQVTKILLDNGAAATYIGGTLPPIHVAFQHSSVSLIKCLIHHGADIHLTDSDDRTALSYCKESMEKEFLLLHTLDTNLSLDGLYKSITKWGEYRSNRAMVWFAFAGGHLECDINVESLEFISEKEIGMVLADKPLYLDHNKERILLETATKPENYSGLCNLMDEKLKTVPTLQQFSRAVIRGLIHDGFSIFPKSKLFQEKNVITHAAFRYLFMLDEMTGLEPIFCKKLLDYLREKNQQYPDVIFENVDEPVYEPAVKKSTGSLSSRFITQENAKHEPQENILVQEIFEWSGKYDSSRWILDAVAGTCLSGLYTNLSCDYPSTECDSFIRGYMRLFNTFLGLLQHRNGPSMKCKGYGSYFAGTQVMELNEMDFMAVDHDSKFHIENVRGPRLMFHVKKSLSKQHHHKGTMKNYLHTALQEFLKNEKRPEDPSTGQVYVQACYPYPVAPAVCTVFAWQCMKGHRHHLSVDLTPAIQWRGRRLGDICTLPRALDREPFISVKDEIEALTPMLIPSPVSYVDVEGDNILSTWELSFSNTSEVMWKCLDAVSPNIRSLFKHAKVIRNHIMPYLLKFSSGTIPGEGSWQGGSVISSWVLYNILLQVVLRNPQGPCWTGDQYIQRLAEFLQCLLRWRYYEFFTGKEEQGTKWSDTPDTLREKLLEEMTRDVVMIEDVVSSTERPETDQAVFSEVVSGLIELHSREVVCVVNTAGEPAVLHYYSAGMGKLRFDTDDVVETVGLRDTHTLCYYKCPQIQRQWLSDPLYRTMLCIIHQKFAQSRLLSTIKSK